MVDVVEQVKSYEQGETERLMEHWKSTLELRNDQYRTFDKAILGVSGGALALSIANVDKFGGGASSFTLLLLLSWLAFGGAIATNITSYWTSTLDADHELEKITSAIETGGEYSVGNKWRRATYGLNFIALILFCAGIALTASHAYRTLSGKPHVAPAISTTTS